MLTISDKLTCPLCGGRFQLHEATAVAEALALAATANRFGKLWPSVMAYAESFQQPGGRGLSLARLMAIINEVAAMFTEKGFAFGRRQHSIDSDVLIAALKETAQAGKSGFKNHNYLKVVAIDMQGQVDKRRGAEKEKQLRQREQDLMAGMRPGAVGPVGSGQSAVGSKPRQNELPEQAKNIDQVGAIIDKLNFNPKKKEADNDGNTDQ